MNEERKSLNPPNPILKVTYKLQQSIKGTSNITTDWDLGLETALTTSQRPWFRGKCFN